MLHNLFNHGCYCAFLSEWYQQAVKVTFLYELHRWFIAADSCTLWNENLGRRLFVGWEWLHCPSSQDGPVSHGCDAWFFFAFFGVLDKFPPWGFMPWCVWGSGVAVALACEARLCALLFILHPLVVVYSKRDVYVYIPLIANIPFFEADLKNG